MRDLCLFVASTFLALGCQAEQGGLGTATEAMTTTTTSTTATSTAEGDGTASSGRVSDTGSGEATVGSSTAGSESGPGDGTASSSTGPTESSSSGPAETDPGDPPPEGEPYGPCLPGDMCMGADVVCYENGGLDMCLPPCDGTNPSCPDAPPDNGALVECIEVQGIHCMLNCAGGAACPGTSVCVEIIGGIFRCLWP